MFLMKMTDEQRVRFNAMLEKFDSTRVNADPALDCLELHEDGRTVVHRLASIAPEFRKTADAREPGTLFVFLVLSDRVATTHFMRFVPRHLVGSA